MIKMINKNEYINSIFDDLNIKTNIRKRISINKTIDLEEIYSLLNQSSLLKGIKQNNK